MFQGTVLRQKKNKKKKSSLYYLYKKDFIPTFSKV